MSTPGLPSSRAEQLARCCWTRRCSRWPRCWNTTSDEPALTTTGDAIQPRSPHRFTEAAPKKQSDLKNKKNTKKTAHSRSLNFQLRVFSCLSPSTHPSYSTVLPLFSSCATPRRRPSISPPPRCFRRDGTRRGYCTPGGRWAGGGRRRTARLSLSFLRGGVFVSESLIVKSRRGFVLFCFCFLLLISFFSWDHRLPWTVDSIITWFVVFPLSRCSRPSCAV